MAGRFVTTTAKPTLVPGSCGVSVAAERLMACVLAEDIGAAFMHVCYVRVAVVCLAHSILFLALSSFCAIVGKSAEVSTAFVRRCPFRTLCPLFVFPIDS